MQSNEMPKTLIIAALEAELKPLKNLGKCKILQEQNLFQFGVVTFHNKELFFLRTGMGPKRIEQAFSWLSEFFAPDKILHIGTCGGFDPDLKCGDLLFAESALRGDTVWQTDLAHTEKLLRACEREKITLRRAVLFTYDEVIMSTQHKAEFWRKTGAAAVDMESAAVLEFAHPRNIPVVVARVVFDSAHEVLPNFSDVLDAVGSPCIGKFIWKVLVHPKLIRELPALGRQLKLCQNVLKKVMQCALVSF